MRHNPFLPPTELVQAISRAVSESREWYFGLRIEDGRRFAAGDYLPDSRIWVDGEVTDETLDGVATIGLGDEATEEEIASALVKLSAYIGDHLVLVGGRSSSYGEDDGEAIIHPGVCVASW